MIKYFTKIITMFTASLLFVLLMSVSVFAGGAGGNLEIEVTYINAATRNDTFSIKQLDADKQLQLHLYMDDALLYTGTPTIQGSASNLYYVFNDAFKDTSENTVLGLDIPVPLGYHYVFRNVYFKSVNDADPTKTLQPGFVRARRCDESSWSGYSAAKWNESRMTEDFKLGDVGVGNLAGYLKNEDGEDYYYMIRMDVYLLKDGDKEYEEDKPSPSPQPTPNPGETSDKEFLYVDKNGVSYSTMVSAIVADETGSRDLPFGVDLSSKMELNEKNGKISFAAKRNMPVETGYTFKGWYTISPGENKKISTVSVKKVSDLNVSAIYAENQYNITYKIVKPKKTKVSGKPVNKKNIKYSQEVVIDQTEITAAGEDKTYRLLGYSRDRNALVPEYIPGEVYSMIGGQTSKDKNIVLYSVWD